MGLSLLYKEKLKLSLNPDLVNIAEDFILHKEHRLQDGTLARNRPYKDTLWLDDLTMSIPFLCMKGQRDHHEDLIHEALQQFLSYHQRMFNEELKLYCHGFVEHATSHPCFAWGRSNGWVMLSLTYLLGTLKKDSVEFAKLSEIFKVFCESLLAKQGLNGLWHQLLNKEQSFEESSATCLFAYGFLWGVNFGLLDPKAFAPAAITAFNALTSKIDEEGKLHGTCVGTGMGMDPAFYAHRLTSPYALHGYGPLFLLISELYKLLKNYYVTLNDCAVHIYNSAQPSDKVTFMEE